jgi:hypothetical protein
MVATPGGTYEITVGPVTIKLTFSLSSKYFGEISAFQSDSTMKIIPFGRTLTQEYFWSLSGLAYRSGFLASTHRGGGQ